MSTATYNRLNKDDAIVLLVDHQTGLISLVQDFSPNEFKNNVLALADLAKYFKLPTILTTSFETGPNGPLVPELKALFPDAPYIARPGQINAWDNEDFVKAIKATGKKQLIIAGVVTEVCVAFPALSALEPDDAARRKRDRPRRAPQGRGRRRRRPLDREIQQAGRRLE